MTKGVILFAHNSPAYNYYKMAEFTAQRIEHFLKLPVTLITDEESLPENPKYNFDTIILEEPNKSNRREFGLWYNKDRFQAYQYSPYEKTIVLDVDYLVNSNKLLNLFNYDTDFMCHNKTTFLTDLNAEQELISPYSFETLWATVIYFRKSTLAKNVFHALSMVQNNYQHYQYIHRFLDQMYRNDYALTLALRIANGHIIDRKNIIPWNLLHVPKTVKLLANGNEKYNTKFSILFDIKKNNKIKTNYFEVNDTDFHVMNKNDFSKLYG